MSYAPVSEDDEIASGATSSDESIPHDDLRLGRWSFLVASLAVLIAIGTPVIGIGVFHGADMILDYAPWAYEAPPDFEPSNPPVGDTVNAAMPMRGELRERLLEGELPLWSRLPASGTPLLAVPDLSPLSPIILPYYVLPLWFAPAISKVLEYAVGVAFTFLFGRRLGLSRVAAVSAGMVFGFSGFQVVWTNWPQTTVGAFIPMLFWAVERAVQLRTVRGTLPVAGAVAFLLFGGFPAVAGFALLAAGVYCLIRLFVTSDLSRRQRATVLASLGLMVVVGVALAAVQILPFLDNLARLDTTHRLENPDGHLPLASLATVFFPLIFGPAADGAYWGPKNVVEINSFVGIVTLVLLAVAATRSHPSLPRGAKSALGGLIAGSTVLIYVGGPPLGFMQDALPFLFGTNAVGRMRAVLGLLVAIMAGVGFDALLSREPGRPSRREVAVGAGVLISAGFLIYLALETILIQPAVVGSDELLELHRMVRRSAVPATIAAGGLALVVVAFRNPRRRAIALAALAGAGVLTVVYVGATAGGVLGTVARNSVAPISVGVATLGLVWYHGAAGRYRLLAAALPVLIAVEAVGFAHPYWARSARDHFYPVTDAHEFLLDNVASSRVALADRTFQPGTTTLYGIPALTAHMFYSPTWTDLVSAVDPRAFEKPTFPKLHVPREDLTMVPTHPIMDRLSVRYFAVNPSLPVFGVRRDPPATSGTISLTQEHPLAGTVPHGRIRGVRAHVRSVDVPEGARAWLHVDVIDGSDDVLATGSRRIDDVDKPSHLTVPLVDVETEASSLTVRLRLETDDGTGIVELGASGNDPSLGYVGIEDNGVRPVWTRGVTIYEQEGWLPRVRWASSTEVIADPEERISRLSSDELPDESVILDRPGPSADGSPARITVLEDTGDALRIEVEAEGAGYLVVADGLQYGWRATLDDEPAELRAADHALGAVAVPAGRHLVTLSFAPASLVVGAGISLGSLLVVLALFLVTRRRTVIGAMGED